MATRKKLSSLKQALQNLGAIRDGLLLLGGGLYVAGYVVWAWIAHIEGLGPLPLLDAQYLIAGIPIATITVFTLALFRFLHTVIGTRWEGYVAGLPPGRQKVIVTSLNLVFISNNSWWFLKNPSPLLVLAAGFVTAVSLSLMISLPRGLAPSLLLYDPR